MEGGGEWWTDGGGRGGVESDGGERGWWRVRGRDGNGGD